MKILFYCSSIKKLNLKEYVKLHRETNELIDEWNQKIVAECECEKVDYYEMEYYTNNLVINDISIYNKVESEEWGHDCFNRVISNEYSDEEIANCPLLKKSCLSFDELGEYVCPKGGIDNFYALHLSNVKVFDEPYDINECYQYRKWQTRLKNAPQNMCKVYGKNGNHYILISIRPEHLCKILNGEKTIEVRKKILNSLKEGHYD